MVLWCLAYPKTQKMPVTNLSFVELRASCGAPTRGICCSKAWRSSGGNFFAPDRAKRWTASVHFVAFEASNASTSIFAAPTDRAWRMWRMWRMRPSEKCHGAVQGKWYKFRWHKPWAAEGFKGKSRTKNEARKSRTNWSGRIQVLSNSLCHAPHRIVSLSTQRISFGLKEFKLIC